MTRKIILRNLHEKSLDGMVLDIPDDVKERIDVPLTCLCIVELTSMHQMEGDAEVFRQSGFRFNELLGGSG